jgi:RNA polymerase sigma factor (TIGR02999 family)
MYREPVIPNDWLVHFHENTRHHDLVIVNALIRSLPSVALTRLLRNGMLNVFHEITSHTLSQPGQYSIMSPEPANHHDRLAEYMPLVYNQLRRLAAHRLKQERCNHTLQPTALVNEVYLKFEQQQVLDIKGRTHFLAMAATAMRQVLVDHARNRNSQKRGGGALLVTLGESAAVDEGNAQNLLDLHRALEKLAALDPVEARVVEMRFFAGLTEVEIARELGISERWVREQWTHAKAWLRKELAP